MTLSLAGSVFVGTSSAAAAAPAVKVAKVYYNSPGTDTRANTSLNAEYVTLTNTTSTAQALTRWTLRDRQNHVFTFPTFTLAPRASVTVRTGKGSNTSTNRYWNQTNYIWNNDTDAATLKNASGTTVHTCAYSSATMASKSC